MIIIFFFFNWSPIVMGLLLPWQQDSFNYSESHKMSMRKKKGFSEEILNLLQDKKNLND